MGREKKKKESWLSFLYLIIALLALRWTVIEPYVVPSPSMEPTLKIGDRLYALKCAYDVRLPFTDIVLFKTGRVKRGDVILFKPPHDPGKIYVKRAVGLAGDRVEFREGHLFINGKPVPMELAPSRDILYDIENKESKSLYIETLDGRKHYMILDNEFPNYRTFFEVRVPKGYIFAVGDNRDHSSDSRVWGFVPEENLKGRAMFIWYSSRITVDTTEMPLIKQFLYFWPNIKFPRPERIGTLIR